MPDADRMLDDLLQDELVLSDFERENYILEPLIPEIDLIQDQNIRNFVRSILLRADAFWDMPVGPEDGLNPPDEYGLGGTVLHTRRVVRLIVVLCDSYGLYGIDKDILVAAALLHDLTKGIRDPHDPEVVHYDPLHLFTVDRYIHFIREDDQKHAAEHQSSTFHVDDEIVGDILRLIHCHKGPYSPIPEVLPKTPMEFIMHTADRVASKLHVVIDGENIKQERWLLG